MDSSNRHRLIHFIPDEKVTDNFISMLESVYPTESRYIVIGTHTTPQKTRITDNAEYYVKGSKGLAEVIENVSGYARVFLHGLIQGAGFEKIKHPDITWVIWGADLYEGLICRRGYQIYVDEEEQYRVRAAGSPFGKIPVWLYKILVGVRDRINFRKSLQTVRHLKRVTAIDEDYNLLREYLPELSVELTPFFSYYPIEKQIGEANMDKECRGRNIWVGNSAAPNGNHSSIFTRLKDYPDTVRIYCPISYGMQQHINHIDRIGKEMLDERFVGLKDYMPAEKYFEKYLDANAFIFGHLRQCGFGSVLMALYFGGKCYFYKDSPLYSYFTRNGVRVFTIDEDLNYESTQEPLDAKTRAANRKFVMSVCSSEAIQKQLRIAFSDR